VKEEEEEEEEPKNANLDRERSDASRHRASTNVVRVYNEIPPIVLP